MASIAEGVTAPCDMDRQIVYPALVMLESRPSRAVTPRLFISAIKRSSAVLGGGIGGIAGERGAAVGAGGLALRGV